MATTHGTASTTTHWELTAPESWVLLTGPHASPQPFKLGLSELITRGVLRTVETGEGRKKTSFLADGPKASTPREPTLAALWELYRSTPSTTTPEGPGAPIDQVARGAKSKFGSVGGFVNRVVLPTLVQQGLYREVKGKVLFIIPKTRYELTDAGRAKRAELEGMLKQGKDELGDWVNNDPSRAMAYVGSAGAALLLMPGIFPEIQRLHQTASVSGDAWALDRMETMGDVDFSLFDRLGDVFESVDSSVDSGAGSDSDSDSDSGGSND